MSRHREAGLPPAGTPLPETPAMAPDATARPRRPTPMPLLPLALIGVAVVAALLASERVMGNWLAALAMLLVAAGALATGALWSRQRQSARLHDARQQQQMLCQMVEHWLWQTDAEHRLVRLQPPQRAPSASWVEGAFTGEPLWQRFDDDDHTLQARLQAHAPVSDLRAVSGQGAARRHWRLRGLPRFDERGRFTGYLGVAEATEQTDSQAAAQQTLEALLRQGPAALCLVGTGAEGQGLVLRRASPAACALLSLAEPPDGRMAWPQALSALPDAFRQRVLALAPGQGTEHDGQSAWLSAVGLAGFGQEGLLVALGSPRSTDEASARALAADHASFSYTISHDLRAPIRVVEGFARILKEDYGHSLDRIGNDHVDRVLGAASRMNHMIDAMLSLSRLSTQPLARQPVNLSQMAGWVIDELRRAAPERQVAVHIAAGLTAQGDPTLLRLVLENLLGNAWKYSSKVVHAEIAFEQVQQNGRPALVVHDNGAGFDMRFADRLFGVFQRLHGSSDFPGTGIGLASVQRIVRRHGGEIWAESEVGQGARFYFTLKG